MPHHTGLPESTSERWSLAPVATALVRPTVCMQWPDSGCKPRTLHLKQHEFGFFDVLVENVGESWGCYCIFCGRQRHTQVLRSRRPLLRTLMDLNFLLYRIC